MRPEYDIVILGGGMAGLSLATRLADAAFSPWRVAVIEPRHEYARDRTWCNFALPAYPHPFSDVASSRWHEWQVSQDRGMVHTCAHPDVAYAMIDSSDFYAAALAKLATASHIDVLRGVSATECALVEDATHESAVTVTTSMGRIGAKLVFDSRPKTTLSENAWRQVFYGVEVESVHPIFDPTRARLMDFSVMTADDANAGRVHFMYLLPSSTRRALVEDTWFIKKRDLAAAPNMEANITSYMATHFPKEQYNIIYREQGALPMDPMLRPSSLASRHIAIGAAGGMTRAASGYAFFDTQQACTVIAAALLRRVNSDRKLAQPFVLPRWRSATSYWMDGVFLRVLQQAPELAPQLFYELFRGVPPASLARFLSGVGSNNDVLRVIAACPKWRFISAAIRSAFNS